MITIKDEREIDLMRHAGHVVGLVHQELAKWLKPGLTTEQVSDFCEKIIRKNGCTPSFLNLYNFPGAVCTSVMMLSFMAFLMVMYLKMEILSLWM